MTETQRSRANPDTAGGRAVFRIEIDGTIDAVWRELTKTGEPQAAIFNSVMHTSGGVAPGSTIQMRTKDGRYVAMVGKILEVDPPRRFSHTIRFTQHDDPECTVVYELAELPGGRTRFTLTVENMPEGTKTASGMKQGGPMICATLKAVVERGQAPLMTRVMFAVFGLLGPLMTPARCKADRWPLQAR